MYKCYIDKNFEWLHMNDINFSMRSPFVEVVCELHLIIVFLTMLQVKVSYDNTLRKIDSIEISCPQY